MEFHTRLDSTNLQAKRRIEEGRAGKLAVIAESQTNGQCRHDRLWESPTGKGIWASFILPVTVPLETLPQSTLVLAVAVREAVLTASGVSLRIKWPNDLLGNGKKCCGLLVETAIADHRAPAIPLVLGVGINANQDEADFPPYLRSAATSLALLSGGSVSRAAVLTAVAAGIDRWFARWREQGFAPVREAWLACNGTLGNAIILPDGYGRRHAVAFDLDPSGALLAVTDDGERLRVDSGEIGFPAQRGDP
ncbi:MAG: biotin--[acetyl-CoA-carboxylase] ligase [Deltaproteobacteria bacterium]|nr:biotin--[acetyl-CoA-carboxylase] ligase [Deltaproteobacteria bacterium]